MGLDEENLQLHLECASLQHKPIKDDRLHTNVPFAKISSCLIIIWFIINTYVHIFHTTWEAEKDTSDNELITVVRDTVNFSRLLIVILVTGLLTIGYIFLLKTVIAKILTYMAMIGIICIDIPLIITAVAIFTFGAVENFKFSEFFFMHLVIIIVLFLNVIYKTAVLCILRYSKKVKIKLISKVINEACRAIFHHFSLLLFSTLVYIQCAMVILVTYLSPINEYKVFGKNYPIILFILGVINILGGLFISACVYYYGHMVISTSVANYYWSVDKNNIQNISIFQTSMKILRYHFGTIGYASLYFPTLNASVSNCCRSQKQHGIRNLENPLVQFVCKLYLTFAISDFALIQTAIYGHDFSESTKKAYNLAISNCSRFFTVIDISGSVLFIIFYILTFVMSLLGFILIQSHNYDSILTLAVLSSLFAVPLISTLYSAIKTTLMCTLEDLKNNDGSAQRPYSMSYELQNVFYKSGGLQVM